MGLALTRCYHKIRDYPKAIKCLNSYLKAKTDAVFLKLIDYFYRRLKNPNPHRALHNYQQYIQRNPRQPDVIKELYQLAEKEDHLQQGVCWELAGYPPSVNVNKVISLRIEEVMNLTKSKAGATGGAELEQTSVQVVKSQAESSNKQNREPELSETLTCEENEEIKFLKWAKIRGLGLTKIGIAGISSVHMLREQAHDYQIVSDMYKPDITPASTVSELTEEFQGDVANATEEIQLFNHEHIKLEKSAELPDPSALVKPTDFSLVAPPLVSEPAALKNKSFQGQNPEEAKKKEDIAPLKFGEIVNREGDKTVLLEHRAKLLRKKWNRKQDRKSGLGNALNLSTSISSDKFFFGLTPAALPATGGFTFGAPNNTSSVSENPLTKSNSNETFRYSPFRFSAASVDSLGSSDGLSSLVLEESAELLFVIRANLYRLTDGDWMMCGPGHVNIWRYIETKTLRVSMWQEKEEDYTVYLNHLLTTDVVYRPMDRKSWIFAAYDLSEGKGVLERFTLRFKNKNAAQEFISAVKTALNGTAKAFKH